MNGQMYAPSAAVVLGVKDDYPNFGVLTELYMVDIIRPYAVVNQMLTQHFNDHYHAYVVERTSVCSVVSLQGCIARIHFMSVNLLTTLMS